MPDYKATPKQWVADRYDWCKADTEAMDGDPAFCCILELRARVEVLELGAGIRDAVAKELDRNYPAKPDSLLVERVASAINPSICADSDLYLQEARAAIREVAAWLKEHGYAGWSVLQQEAER
jgi:hypothetical protein